MKKSLFLFLILLFNFTESKACLNLYFAVDKDGHLHSVSEVDGIFELIDEFEDSKSIITEINKKENKTFKSISFKVQDDKFSSYFSCFYQNNRLYSLIIEYPNVYDELVSELKDQFFNSFKCY